MTVLGFIAILGLGFFFGWIFRGAVSKSRISRVKDDLREQELQTKIQRERLAQDHLLDERIK